MCHPIKFACRYISSSIGIVELVIFDYMSPHCDLEIEEGKPIFSHDTPAHDDASPTKFDQERFSSYHPDDDCSLEF